MVNRFLSLPKKILHSLVTISNLFLIRRSGLFDSDWYLAQNPDVKQAKLNGMLHYLRHGGFEGRDPGPRFSSSNYFQIYEDVKKAGMNPLIHYLKYGQREGRLAQPEAPAQQVKPVSASYACPVCKNEVEAFVPLSSFYLENIKQYGYPYTFAEAETLNSEGYTCPHCGASDRDRLYACYLEKKRYQYPAGRQLVLLDIAPSIQLGRFIDRLENVVHHTGDLLIEGVDFSLDITNMPEMQSNSYDILICSHVLEHVSDDRKALAELYRILKPGGWGIIMVPIILTLDQIDEDPQVTDVAERWRRFGQYDHVRLYNKRGFVERVESAGFHLKQLDVDYFGASTFRRYGVTTQSVLYIAEKKPAFENE